MCLCYLTFNLYIDDMLIFGSTSLYSMQNIKLTFLCFELVSGMKVNFLKNNIINVGIEDQIFYYTTQILWCNQEQLPFKCLGLPIGASSCRTSMWKPIFHNINFRLASWKGRILSILLCAMLAGKQLLFLKVLVVVARGAVLRRTSSLKTWYMEYPYVWCGEIDKTKNSYPLLVERGNDSRHLVFWSLETLTDFRDWL